MLKRSEIGLIVAVTAVLAGTAWLGTVTAPRGMSLDQRLSTRLTGPNGARAFKELLQHVGVPVGERLRPLFDLDRTRAEAGLLLVVARPAAAITAPEVRAARQWVARGGRLLLMGASGIERCFGYAMRVTEFTPMMGGADIVAMKDRVLPEPHPRARLEHLGPGDTGGKSEVLGSQRCEPLVPVATDVLWTAKRDTAAVRLHFRSGGEAVLVADGGVFSNRSLRSTDAGVLVLGWVLDEHPRQLLVDEYHQGFGSARSLPGAVVAWAWSAPAGWMAFQLAFAGLLALLLAAIRFGPAIPAVERRRRSPLEHLDALAAGLERSGAALTATRLIASGLRRRLGGAPLRPEGTAVWLETLETGAQRPAAREAAARLRRRVTTGAGADDVRDAALAVEDLWRILKVPSRTTS